jgi:hypothetical protein
MKKQHKMSEEDKTLKQQWSEAVLYSICAGAATIYAITSTVCAAATLTGDAVSTIVATPKRISDDVRNHVGETIAAKYT